MIPEDQIESLVAKYIKHGQTIGIGSSELGIKFLKKIESGKLEGVKVAAFDTRVAVEDTNVKILKGMIKLFGYAAEPIAKLLAQKGGKIIVKPIGVYVDDTKGPIKDGEKEKVIKWIENVK